MFEKSHVYQYFSGTQFELGQWYEFPRVSDRIMVTINKKITRIHQDKPHGNNVKLQENYVYISKD